MASALRVVEAQRQDAAPGSIESELHPATFRLIDDAEDLHTPVGSTDLQLCPIQSAEELVRCDAVLHHDMTGAKGGPGGPLRIAVNSAKLLRHRAFWGTNGRPSARIIDEWERSGTLAG